MPAPPVFPTTRYQGSKRKLAGWIWDSIDHLEFDTALDAFGGTGTVAYCFKQHGKAVTYNDDRAFNGWIGKALIENDHTRLSEDDIQDLLAERPGTTGQAFIAETFRGIYYTEAENAWLDRVVPHIRMLGGTLEETGEAAYKKALGFYALFQACLVKRPFNLFHRKNLDLRFREVRRRFGNKTTWDTPFETHFRKFAAAANRAVFSNGRQHRALNRDVFDLEGRYDLVYLDPPYLASNGVGVNYQAFYHFLEGLVHYDDWADRIDPHSCHKAMKPQPSVWMDKTRIHDAFARLFEKFEEAILVVSYRSDGIPSVEELTGILKRYKSSVQIMTPKSYQYALSTRRTEEVLLIATGSGGRS